MFRWWLLSILLLASCAPTAAPTETSGTWTIQLAADAEQLPLLMVSGPGNLAVSFEGKTFWRETANR